YKSHLGTPGRLPTCEVRGRDPQLLQYAASCRRCGMQASDSDHSETRTTGLDWALGTVRRVVRRRPGVMTAGSFEHGAINSRSRFTVRPRNEREATRHAEPAHLAITKTQSSRCALRFPDGSAPA